jgi:hypothetical protein
MTNSSASAPEIYKGFLDYNSTYPLGKTPKQQLAQDAQMYFNGSKRIHACEEDQNVNVFKIDSTGLVCVDTDDKYTNDYIVAVMEKYGVDTSKLKCKSVSNHFLGGEYIHKYHYWFSTDFFVEKKIGVNGTKLDILTKEVVFEPIVPEGQEAYRFATPLTKECYADIMNIASEASQSEIQFPKVDQRITQTENIVLVDSSIPLEEIKFIDENTDPKDAKEYSSWKKVMFKIANKYGKTALGLKMARYFSGKCMEKFKIDEVDTFYNAIKLEKVQDCIFGLSKVGMELKKKELKEQARELLRKTMEEDRKQKEAQKEELKGEKQKLKKAEQTKKESLKKEIMERRNQSIDEQEQKYMEMKTDFEKVRVKIIASGLYAEIFGISDNINMFSKKQMYDKYCHMSYGNDEKGYPTSFIERWIKDPQIKKYDDIDIYPKVELCPPNVYNLWRPFAMENVTKYEEDLEGLKLILDHIKILCNHDEVAYCQFMTWMAHMIQHPEQRSICPTIISAEGTGKTTLYLWLQKILGADKCFKTSQPMLHLFGNFNSAILNKILIFQDDPDVENLVAYNTKMLDHITAEDAEIHKKGESVFVTKAFHRAFICTNKPQGLLKEEKNGSRRNLTITASDEKVGDSVYFTKLYALRDNVNTMKTFYEYLKGLPDVPLVLERPIKTDFQNAITAASKKPLQLWLEEFVGLEFCNLVQLKKRIENGSKEKAPEGDYLVTLSTTDLLNKYTEFCTLNKFKFMNEDAVKIGVSLFHLKRTMKLSGDCIVNKHTKKCEKKIFNITKLADALGTADLDDDDEEEE